MAQLTQLFGPAQLTQLFELAQKADKDREGSACLRDPHKGDLRVCEAGCRHAHVVEHMGPPLHVLNCTDALKRSTAQQRGGERTFEQATAAFEDRVGLAGTR